MPSTAVRRWVTTDGRAAAELRVSGSLDFSTRRSILDVANTAMATAQHLELDAGDVDFIDASGIAAIIEVANLAVQRGVSFTLTRRSEAVQRLLDILGTDFRWASGPRPPDSLESVASNL
ncbi:MAG: STAS domain-containing protein [Marmoricola sp.]